MPIRIELGERMQPNQSHAFLPNHPNVVELAALLEDSRLKSSERQHLQTALREFLLGPVRPPAELSKPGDHTVDRP